MMRKLMKQREGGRNVGIKGRRGKYRGKGEGERKRERER
jgi:hypothetical protein